MENKCSIAEDLLPLYQEYLLQDETAKWLEEHFKSCEECAKLNQLSDESMADHDIPNTVDYQTMMSRATFKLSFYQLIILGISFFLAIRTVILEENFEFIMLYTIIGLVTYLFYKKFSIVTLISFLPVFIWHLGTMIIEHKGDLSLSRWDNFFDISFISLFAGLIHLLF